MKKLYPNLDHRDENTMQVIGTQLIDGIKINKEGKIQIN